MTLIDTLCHLDFSQFDPDREQEMQRAWDAHIKHIIIPSVTVDNWAGIDELAAQHAALHAAYGLHPMFIDEHPAPPATIKEQLRQQLLSSDAVAIGECGLDFFFRKLGDEQRRLQLDIFIAHLELAGELDLPLIIHSRKSLDMVLKHLRRHQGVRGVIHSFSGSLQQAKQCIDLGFYLGFGGPITYTRAHRLRRLVRELPLDAILLESDAPDQPDASHHGLRNEPAYLPLIARAIAELRNCDGLEIAAKTTHNASWLFNLKTST